MIQHLKLFKALSIRPSLSMIALLAAMPITSGSLWAAAPLYEVTNDSSNSSVPNSFPSALAYVNSNGGNITFSPGARDQICRLGNILYINNPITFDLSGLSLFSIDGSGNGYGIQAIGSTPAVLDFISSSGSGAFIFRNGSIFANIGSSTMTTAVGTGETLTLSGGSRFWNGGSSASMITTITGTLSLSGNSVFANYGTDMTTNVGGTLSLSSPGSVFQNFGSGAMMTTVESGGALSFAQSSYFRNDGTAMTTNVYGIMTLSDYSKFWNAGSGRGNATIHRGGLLFMDTGSLFYGGEITIAEGGTFSSGVYGASFLGSSFTLFPGATHQAAIGMGGLPVETVTYNSISSIARLGSATLNVISFQNLPTLQGNTYTILTADPGSSITGQYGTQQYNGSSLYLPYEVEYLPNSSSAASVNVVFPPANIVRNNASDPLVPYSFPAALAYANNNEGNITFDSGVSGQTCTIAGTLYVTRPLIFDLSALSPSSVSLSGDGIYNVWHIESTGSNPAGFTFLGNGTFSFIGGSSFANLGSGPMTMAVRSGATLSLAGSGCEIANYGDNSMATTVESGATLSLEEGGYFTNGGSGAGTLTSAGLLSMNTGGFFWGNNAAMTVLIEGKGTFAAGIGGASFQAADLTLSPNATHQAAIGTGGQAVQIITYNGRNSTATLGGATLNVVSSQSLASLLGNTYPIVTADPGNSILGQYGTQQFNGSSIYLPYELDYHSNSSSVTSVNVVFPPANVVRNSASDPLVPHSFPAALAYVNVNGGNITFGPGALGQTCATENWLFITNPINIDLTELGSAGFAIDGGISSGGGFGIYGMGSNPSVGLTFRSSGGGNFSFINGSYFVNHGSGVMTTAVETEATLALSHSNFDNYGTEMTTRVDSVLTMSGSSRFLNLGSGIMTTQVNGTLELSESSTFQNQGAGAMATTVAPEATLTLSGSSFINHGTNITTDVYGSLTLSSSAIQNAGSGAIITTVKPGGILTISLNSNFYNYASGTDMTTNVNGALRVLGGSSGFTSHGSGAMTTTVSANATLALSVNGSFQNYGTDMTTDVYGALTLSNTSLFQNLGSGPITTNVYGTLSLSSNSYFDNEVSGTMITNVYGLLTLAGSSFFRNYGSVFGPMNTDVYGTLALSDGSAFANVFSGVATIHSGGLLSLDTGAYFHGEDVVIQGAGTFASGAGGASFGGLSFTLSSGATHQAVTGTESQPIRLSMWAGNARNSTATLGGATLNIVSPQSLNSLQGNNYSLWATEPGSSIIGQYGTQQFNGSSLYLPYELDYRPSSSATPSVNVVFPPANVVRNNSSDSLVPYSFPAVLAYVDGLRGTPNITFGPGASGQTCMLRNTTYVSNPLTFNLAGLGRGGFTINGGGSGYYIQATGPNPADMTFTSSSGNGTFSFINSGFLNQGSGPMTTTVGTGATLAITNGGFQHWGTGPMTTNIYGTLTSCGGGGFRNIGASMTTNVYGRLAVSCNGQFVNSGGSPMRTNVYGTLTLSHASFYTYEGVMTTDVYGTLILAEDDYGSAFIHYGSDTMTVSVHKGGLLSMNGWSDFYGGNVVIEGGGTFSSQGSEGELTRVAHFLGSTFTLSPNATHQVTIGARGPIQLFPWEVNGKNSTATLGGATLNIISAQSLNSLQGNNYTLWTADPGSSILGSYGTQQFNGSSINLPYRLYYLPNTSVIDHVIVGFPTPTPVPTIHPTKSPTATPSLLPTHLPSAIMATLVPTATRLITNLTTNFTNGTVPLGPPAGDAGESWEQAPYVITPIVAAGVLTLGAVGYKVGKWLGWWGKDGAACTSSRKQSRKMDINDTELEGSLASSRPKFRGSVTYNSPQSHSDGSAPFSSSEQREFDAIAHPPRTVIEWREDSHSQEPLTHSENNSLSPQRLDRAVELSVLDAHPPVFHGIDPQTPQSSFRPVQIYRAEGELPPLVPQRPPGLGRPEYEGDLVPTF